MQPIDTPFFSVIIPSYNRANLIARSINSVLQQEYKSYEILVIDDGSTDDTASVVKEFEARNVFYYKKENGERGAARNFGWRKAKGEYVTFLDSDDIFYPNHLQTAYTQLSSLSLPACYAQAFEMKNSLSGKIIQKGYHAKSQLINKEILNANFLACFGVFIKCSVREQVVFEEERKFAGTEDWLLWLQLAARHPFYFNNQVTGALLHHEQRSVLTIDNGNLMFRPAFIKEKLSQDDAFLKKYGKAGVRQAFAHVLSYVSLHLAAANDNRRAMKYFFQMAGANPRELFRRRTLGIFKTIFFNKANR